MNLWKSLLRVRRPLSRGPCTRQPAKSARPALESLEDRLAPANLALYADNSLRYYDGVGVANNLTVSLAGSTYTFTDTAETISAHGFAGDGTYQVTVPRGSFNHIIIDLIDGNDTVNVESCHDPITIVKHAGNDTVNLSPVAKNQDNIQAAVDVEGDGNDLVTVYDQQNTRGQQSYSLKGADLYRGLPYHLTYHSCKTLEIDGSQGALNEFDVEGTGGAAATILKLAGDSDTVDLALSSGSLTGLNNLTINGGGSYENLILNDLHGASRTYTITESAITGDGFGPINYSGIKFLYFYGSSAPNTFNLQGVAAGTGTEIGTRGGNDTINLGYNNQLDRVNGLVDILTQSGTTEVLNVNDQGHAGGDTYTVTGSTVKVARLPGLLIYYSDVSSLTLNTGSGSDTINLTPSSTTPFTVNANAPFSSSPTSPGDSLNLDLTGVNVSHLAFNSAYDGQWTFTNRAAVSFTSVESVSPGAALPHREDFSGGVADYLMPQLGNWSVGGGRYNAAPAKSEKRGPPANTDVVSTLLTNGPLPSGLEVDATMNADAAAGSYYSNGFLVFDYKSANDFKYAGAYVGNQQWVIGHRDATGWQVDTSLTDTGIKPGTDYALRVLLQGGTATLLVNGAGKLNWTYGSAFTGAVGLGSRNGLTHFGSVVVQPYAPPQGQLPIHEDFNNGTAPFFVSQSGTWVVTGGRYVATPVGGGDAVSTLSISGALPSSLEFDVTMNAPASGTYYSNGFIVFDYQGPTNFKYAGAFVGNQQWVVGHRDASGWHNDSAVSDPGIAAGKDANLQLLLQGSKATLVVGGVSKTNYTYASGFSGSVGLGTWNSPTQFGNLTVQQYSPQGSGTLPIQETFDDGSAHYFSPQSGTWGVSAGRYVATPVGGGDALSTLSISGALPANLEFDVLMNAAAAGTYYSNGFIVFDYQGPTNFKYAGAFVGNQQWVVGHRDASGWNNDSAVSDPGLAAGADYNLQLLLQGTKASLVVNGASKTSYTYASGFSGSVGLGTWNGLTQFDNLIVKSN